jgi:beta-glucanase (GH16 family)
MKTLFARIRQHAPLGAGLVLALSLSGCTESKTKNVPTPLPPTPTNPVVNEDPRDYSQYNQLVASDEFSGSLLDAQKWQYEVRDDWFNNEKQATTNSPQNLYLSNGELHIVARREQLRNKAFTSARIVTRDKLSFGYGRVDVRAKLPKGKGIWPAIWMLGVNEAQVGWPVCGEIDIMELRGSLPNESISTVHFGTSPATRQERSSRYRLPAGDFSDDFHVFSLIRSKDQLRFFVDGQLSFTITPTNVSPYPFNNPFYMILNVAVGGDFDGDPSATEPFPKEMVVDYMRFYQYAQ